MTESIENGTNLMTESIENGTNLMTESIERAEPLPVPLPGNQGVKPGHLLSARDEVFEVFVRFSYFDVCNPFQWCSKLHTL